ncbi:MAG TPA: MMPL family transporter [Candidatus Methanoperedens sp.]|nr:MMPL family transporter [Candidatus Methanoperedens sp.]
MSGSHGAQDRIGRFFDAVTAGIQVLVSRPLPVLLVALALAILGGKLAAGLRVDTDLSKLLPPDHPSVVALEKLRRTVGGETNAAVIIDGPRLEASHAFARALVPRLRELRQSNGEPYFTRVEYRREVDFLRSNALYLATEEELDTLERYLRKRIEETRLEANPMFVDLLEDDEQHATSKADEDQVRTLRHDLIPKEYPVSEDGRTLVLRLFLAGSKADLGYVDGVFDVVGREVRRLNPRSFDSEMTAEVAGPLLRHRVEMHAIEKDVFTSVGSGIVAVLLIVAAYFFLRAYQVRRGTAPRARIILSELARTPVAALVIGLPLGMSLAWTFGIAYLRFGALNLMTATLALVLFGLGIEFGIHVFARYTEERGCGHGSSEAMRRTLLASVQPLLISASTTIASFGLLSFAQFRGFSEFGFISALGLVFALIAMIVVLPALLLLLERTQLMHLEAAGFAPPAAAGSRRWPLARTVVVLSLVCSGLAAVKLPAMRFEWNFSRLEPEFPETDRLADLYQTVYPPGGRNPAYVLVDTPGEVPAVVRAARQLMESDRESPTIKSVESLQERFPSDPAAQRAKLERIAGIRVLLDDKYLRRAESEDVAQLRSAAAVREPIPLAALPESLRAAFTARDGTIGNFVLIYPIKGMSDGRNSMAFADDIGRIATADGRVYHAASSSLVAAEMLRLMRKESPVMVLLSAAGLLLLVPLAFRQLWLSVLALTPLTVGVFWMLAINASWDMGFNFYNLVVLPTVLGMGEDAGVHLVHRWVEEGPGSVTRVMGSTGEAVMLCAFTGMLGFSGMLTSFHPGLRSMGVLAVTGLGATLITSLVLLPAVLQLIDDRRARGRSDGSRG